MITLISRESWLRNTVNWVLSWLTLRRPRTGTPIIEEWRNTTRNFGAIPLGRYQGNEDVTRVEFVTGLTRKQLITEVFRLDREAQRQDILIQSLEEEKSNILELFRETHHREQSRYDALLDRQLGKSVDANQTQSVTPKPIRRRAPWGQVASEFEKKKRILANDADKRHEQWVKKIEEVEQNDKKVAGGSGAPDSPSSGPGSAAGGESDGS
jgi:hypothetical protein